MTMPEQLGRRNRKDYLPGNTRRGHRSEQKAQIAKLDQT